MASRSFHNKFESFTGEKIIGDDGKIPNDWQQALKSNIDKLLQKLYAGLQHEDDSNSSVYTGIGGIALLHLHMYIKLGKDLSHVNKAYDYIRHHLRHLKGKRVTFLCGDAGVLALGVVICSILKKEEKSKDCLQELLDLHDKVCSDRTLPDELLYGRVGYLFALLFVQHHLGKTCVNNSIIQKVFTSVIESGQSLAQKTRTSHPLMYAWHDKYYLGAAHGLAGIFYTLMQVKDDGGKFRPYLVDLVRPSIDYMLTLQFPSGNGPSSLESTNGDKLVHWCHGAPGWIYMFVKAYQIFSDTKYLDAARRCADVIWERGLLKKGYGICHGTAGNAYAFILMYRLTKEEKYLHQAYKFAEWCFNYGHHGCESPDTPFSMFEGMAGTIYFLIDMLDPENAKFPAYEL